MESFGSDQSLMNVVLQFFQEDQWNYQKIENKPVVRTGYRGERGTWICYARLDSENEAFLFHTLMGLNIPPQQRGAVAEYLMRVNMNLPVGGFEIDFEHGAVRYKIGVYVPDHTLTVGMIRTIAYASLRMMDHYSPGVLSVVHGGLSPEAALARVDSQTVEEA
jgi:hypothetical protein